MKRPRMGQRMGQSSLVPFGGGPLSPIPSKEEIVKDAIKWFVGKYGLDLVDAVFQASPTVDAMKQAIAERQQQRQLASGGGGGGIALLAIAALALSGKKSKRRRR